MVIKIPFKLLVLPLILVLSVVYLIGKIAGGLSDFAIGLVYSLVFLGAVLVVINQAWSVLIGLGVIALLAFLFQFAEVLCLELVRGVRGKLVNFVVS